MPYGATAISRSSRASLARSAAPAAPPGSAIWSRSPAGSSSRNCGTSAPNWKRPAPHPRAPRATDRPGASQPGRIPNCLEAGRYAITLPGNPCQSGTFERESGPMRVENAINIEDLHRMAKRRLPKVAFDFIEGGLEDEHGLDRNTAAFHKHHLLPRYLVDVSKRDQSATIFGQTFSSPFGISPTGSAGLFRRGADMMLAEAAREANIPYIMSGASNETIEDAARVAPKNAWYQLYAARDGKISDDLIKRTADAGLSTLVLTVDVPVHSKRERNMRNGFANIRGNWLQDAVRAAEIGCDGVIVSNHGARQLDQAPASLDVLPAVKRAVGDRMTIMLDSGVRRGADILIAMCLGAQFCFFGRPTLYGAVAGGLPGVKKAVDIFRHEIDLVMGQIGCPSLDQLGPDFLWTEEWQRNR